MNKIVWKGSEFFTAIFIIQGEGGKGVKLLPTVVKWAISLSEYLLLYA